MNDDDWIDVDDLRQRLGTTPAAVRGWLHLAPSVDRRDSRIQREEAILVALAIRLRQHGMTQRAAGAVVGELLRSVEDPLTADWVVVKDGPKRATVHLGGVIGLDRPGVVAVVDAAELRAMLAY